MNRYCVNTYLTGPWRIENNQLVGPVVMMVEGVHSGSMGPVFWHGDVLRAGAARWNGTPATLDHPPGSINESAEIQKTFTVGRITNARYDHAKRGLQANVRVPLNCPHLSKIQYVREVSAGVWGNEIPESGTWRGEPYHLKATNMLPDHLALLTEARGACSWQDGCGVRMNEQLQLNENGKWEVWNAVKKTILQGGKNMDIDEEPLQDNEMRTAQRQRGDGPSETDFDDDGVLTDLDIIRTFNKKKQNGQPHHGLFEDEEAPLL
jgi:hypothetical protein